MISSIYEFLKENRPVFVLFAITGFISSMITIYQFIPQSNADKIQTYSTQDAFKEKEYLNPNERKEIIKGNYTISDTSIGWIYIGMSAEQINHFYSDSTKYILEVSPGKRGSEDLNSVNVKSSNGEVLIYAVISESNNRVTEISTTSKKFQTTEKVSVGLSIDDFLKKFQNYANGIELRQNEGPHNYEYFSMFNRHHVAYITSPNKGYSLFINEDQYPRRYSHDGYIYAITVNTRDMYYQQ